MAQQGFNGSPQEKRQMALAANKGDVVAVKALLDGGASVELHDDAGMTPLMAAAFGGAEALFDLMIARGADINAQANGSQGTALMFAVQLQHDNMIPKILAARPDVNQQDRMGQTALMLAATHGNEKLIRQLLELGADHTITSNANVNAQAYADAAGKKIDIADMAREVEQQRKAEQARADEAFRQQVADLTAPLKDKVTVGRPLKIKTPVSVPE